jgi:hypothetical protein
VFKAKVEFFCKKIMNMNVLGSQKSRLFAIAIAITVAVIPVVSSAALAPKIDTTFHFVKEMCPSYAVIRGNQNAKTGDATGGNYIKFSNYKGGNTFTPLSAKPVLASEVPAGCVAAAGWSFKLSTDEAQTKNVSIAGTSGANGEYTVKLSSLADGLRSAVTKGSSIWVSEITQSLAQFGALRCYTDALNGDNLEFINLGNNKTGYPQNVYCIAYNVADCVKDSDCNDNNLHTSDVCDLSTYKCVHTAIPYCGDGIVSGSEQCEGNTNLDCQTTAGYPGKQACDASTCQLGTCVSQES